MYEIEEISIGKKFVICKYCHKSNPKLLGEGYKWAESSTKRAVEHMESVYSCTEKGKLKSNRPQVFEQLQNQSIENQHIINTLITSFDPKRFKQLFTRWIIIDNIALDQVDSSAFWEMMLYANDGLEHAGCLPTRNTIWDWIIKDYKGYKGVVTELLKTLQGKVNISFNMWSSKNLLYLYSLVVHFIANGKLYQFLLSILWLIGVHS